MLDHWNLGGRNGAGIEARGQRCRRPGTRYLRRVLRKSGTVLQRSLALRLPGPATRSLTSRGAVLTFGIALGLVAAWGHHLWQLPLTPPAPVIGPGSIAYNMTVARQQVRSQQVRNAIALFGDSHTVALASSRLEINTENFGINSDTLDGLFKRLPQYHLGGVTALVIEIGINDISNNTDPDHFGAKYAALLSRLPQRIPVIAVAVFPVRDASIQRRQIRQTNASMAVACRRYPDCHFLDLTRLLAGPDGLLKREYAEPDGVHLTATGNEVWSEVLRHSIKQYCLELHA
jgi:lysophospholipase L1-like esterase